MPSLEECLEQADLLAQEVVNAEGVNRQVGKPSSAQFMDMFDKARRYLTAKRHADDGRKHHELTKEGSTDEQATRRTFAEAYKSWHEEQDRFRQRPD